MEMVLENFNSAYDALKPLLERNTEAIFVGLVVTFIGLAISGTVKGIRRALSIYYIKYTSQVKKFSIGLIRLHVRLYLKHSAFRQWVDINETHYFRLTIFFGVLFTFFLISMGIADSKLKFFSFSLGTLLISYPFTRAASGYLVYAYLRHKLIKLVRKRIQLGKGVPDI